MVQPTSTAQNDTFSYDNGGNTKEIADTVAGQQQCYTYDGLNRLTAAYTTTAAAAAPVTGNCGGAVANHTGGPNPYDLVYSYDTAGLGNLKTVTDKMTTTPIVSTYAYPADTAANPAEPYTVTTVTHTGGATGTDTYGYDANGDMNARTVGGVPGTITYTPQQKTATITAGGSTTQYLYDATGNLLIRKGPDGATLYLPGQELHAVGNTITPTRYYTSGTATVAQRVGGNTTNGTLTWLTNDNQNSAQLAINPTNGAVTRQRYLPFGAQRGTQGPPTGSQHAYLSRIYDPATGLLQDGARLYDPSLAKFLTPDPLVGTVPVGLNAYAYGNNNPTTFVDPSGLCATNDPGALCIGNSSNPGGPNYVADDGCTSDTTCDHQAGNDTPPDMPPALPPIPQQGPDGTIVVPSGPMAGQPVPADVYYAAAGTPVILNLKTVQEVCAKYGLDYDMLTKYGAIIFDRGKRGVGYGMTNSKGIVTLYSEAGQNEGQLAITLKHELVHVEDLANGGSYPKTEQEVLQWEKNAYEQTNEWYQDKAMAVYSETVSAEEAAALGESLAEETQQLIGLLVTIDEDVAAVE